MTALRKGKEWFASHLTNFRRGVHRSTAAVPSSQSPAFGRWSSYDANSDESLPSTTPYLEQFDSQDVSSDESLPSRSPALHQLDLQDASADKSLPSTSLALYQLELRGARSTFLRSLGTLSDLPLEIRQKIYGFTFHGRYHLTCPCYKSQASSLRHFGRCDARRANMPILAVSKAVSREAKHVLYADGVFVAAVREHQCKARDISTDTMKLIRNIEVRIYVHEFDRLIWSSGSFTDYYLRMALPNACEYVFEPLSGITTIRNTCTIDLSFSESHRGSRMISRHLVKMLCGYLQGLTGHQRLHIQLAHLDPSSEQFDAGAIIAILCTELGPVMGPSKLTDKNTLRFRPLDFIAANKKEEQCMIESG